MNQYRILKEKQQKEFNEAHLLGFAFGQKQFDELMKRWGINPNSKKEFKKVAHVFSGAYILVENIPSYRELLRRQQAEFDAAVAADQTGDGFIYQMFYEELCNHEFGYTGETEDTLNALGYSASEIMANPRLKHGLEKAVGEILCQEECSA